MPRKKLPHCMGQVVRFSDYEKKSREPDAEGPRHPDEPCTIYVLPSVKVEHVPDAPCEVPCM